MIRKRPAGERGHFDHGWLDTWHTFSFGDYRDPDHLGFRVLRVINEDFVQPGQGFGTHPHHDMEILTYVVSGALEHKDSLGNGSVIRPGDIQRMSAGTGVAHSEFNPSADEPVHLLQIWVLPRAKGLAPGYEQKHFPAEARAGRLLLVASPDGEEPSVTWNQDVRLRAGLLAAGLELEHPLANGRHAWVQVVKGALSLNGTRLAAGDGAAASGEDRLVLSVEEAAEVLVFDLP